MDKKDKPWGLIVVLSLLIIAFIIVIFWPKKDKIEDNSITQPTASPLDIVLVDPEKGFITNAEILGDIRSHLGDYADANIEEAIFKTVDSDTLYARIQYDEYTVIGISYCISTGDTVCDISRTESSMLPSPFEKD